MFTPMQALARLLLPVLAALPASVSLAQERVLAAGTPSATPWFLIEGAADGPTVMVVGGIHGNEPAGALAAEQVLSWTVGRGRLVVVPRANVLALQANQRRTPEVPEEEGDLNRQFPSDREPAEGIAAELWELLVQQDCDWLLDLHEGYDFHRVNSDSVGSSVIACAQERAVDIARAMIAAVDEGIEDAQRKFTLLRNPVEGSLARAAWERSKIPSMIAETTSKNWVLSYRARQHRTLVHCFLTQLDMQPCSSMTLLSRERARGRVRVAVFDGSGTGKGSATQMIRTLAQDPGLVLGRVGSPDVRAGALSQFDVVVHPGGSASKQARSLGESGRAAEIEFVRGGGGYLGVCAGAYLASCNYDWSLGLLDAQVIDRQHWKRGEGLVQVEWTVLGQAALAAPGAREGNGRFDMRYANGPVLMPAERDDIPDFESLLIYRGEVAQNGAPKGIMPGTAAAIRGRFGTGRALAFSPHPEKTSGLHPLLHRSIRWLAEDPR